MEADRPRRYACVGPPAGRPGAFVPAHSLFSPSAVSPHSPGPLPGPPPHAHMARTPARPARAAARDFGLSVSWCSGGGRGGCCGGGNGGGGGVGLAMAEKRRGREWGGPLPGERTAKRQRRRRQPAGRRLRAGGGGGMRQRGRRATAPFGRPCPAKEVHTNSWSFLAGRTTNASTAPTTALC